MDRHGPKRLPGDIEGPLAGRLRRSPPAQLWLGPAYAGSKAAADRAVAEAVNVLGGLTFAV